MTEINTSWYADYSAEKAKKDYEAARKSAQATCFTKLDAMTHTFADGRTVQVRPRDEPNFKRQIEKGIGRDWIMADNTVSHLTLAELKEAVASGESQGDAIYDEYMAALEVLDNGEQVT